jgi:hypothetical protein
MHFEIQLCSKDDSKLSHVDNAAKPLLPGLLMTKGALRERLSKNGTVR